MEEHNNSNENEMSNRFNQLNSTIADGLMSILGQYVLLAERINELENRVKQLEEEKKGPEGIVYGPGFSIN